MFVTELILEVALKEENHTQDNFSISLAICLYLRVCVCVYVQSFHFHTSALVRAMIRDKESKMILRLKWKNLSGRGYVSLSKEIMSSKQIIMINYSPASFYDFATDFTMQRFHFNDINYYKVFFPPQCLL